IRTVGFDVPETLVTNDPGLVRDFVADHGRVIYKSISGARSIVAEVDDDALARLDDVRWCPVQFQAYVEGVDVRVHVVGRRVFSTRVASDAADYRYAAARAGAGGPVRARPGALHGARRPVGPWFRGDRPPHPPRRAGRRLRGDPLPRLHLLRGPHGPADRPGRRRPPGRRGGLTPSPVDG